MAFALYRTDLGKINIDYENDVVVSLRKSQQSLNKFKPTKELKSIAFAVYETALGTFRIDYEDDIVVYLRNLREQPCEFGVKTKFTDSVFYQLDEYFNGVRSYFDFKYELRGTEFQKKVWKTLCTIPYGETCTYKEIAKSVGNKKASHAVGLANSKNPILIVIPCHRVIGSKGDLVGYAGGLYMKEALLKIEEISNI